MPFFDIFFNPTNIKMNFEHNIKMAREHKKDIEGISGIIDVPRKVNDKMDIAT